MTNPNQKETVLLTGANGQLGQSICKKLSSQYEIFNLDVSYGDAELSDHHINVDIADAEASCKGI